MNWLTKSFYRTSDLRYIDPPETRGDTEWEDIVRLPASVRDVVRERPDNERPRTTTSGGGGI